MNTVPVAISVDEQWIKEKCKQVINEYTRKQILFWDIDDMTELTPYGRTFLEENLLSDPRMKALERRKGKGKRIWPYEESSRVLKNIIMNEW